ncbi:DUF4386 domain-containing protein [Streptomyces sp. NRRL S-87]|uniref:DUF4386 domain-containing protein n=1 Tax=Streptomyces sp. NRRL S-87 TaxID=1463920 RepID=UPI000A883BEE|nr:DUF4386 domain-containing protein [Streptomyces sp. NRRL S-87]
MLVERHGYDAQFRALALYEPVLAHAEYVTGRGPDAPVLLGALFEVGPALAVVGTAVTLFPVVRRHGEGLALGYAALRTLEAAAICVGIVSLLAVVTLRRDGSGAAGPDADALRTVGGALVAVHDWTFLLGPNFVLGANTVLAALLMYRSRLVPRPVAVLGLVGGPLILASATAVLFGPTRSCPRGAPWPPSRSSRGNWPWPAT